MTIYKYHKVSPADVETMIEHIHKQDPKDKFDLEEFGKLSGTNYERLRRYLETGSKRYELPHSTAVLLSLFIIPANLHRARLIAKRMIKASFEFEREEESDDETATD